MSDPENDKDDPYELFSSPKKGVESTAKYYGKTSAGSSGMGKSETERKLIFFVIICTYTLFSLHILFLSHCFWIFFRFDVMSNAKKPGNAQVLNDQEELAQMENIFDSFNKSGARLVLNESQLHKKYHLIINT